MPQVIRYRFRQKFNVPALKAYEWSTDYEPTDMTLMQQGNAKRKVQRISRDSLILVDTFVVEGKPIAKQKLVCLYPDRLMWTSTHVTGPNKYSQFLYEITSETDEQSCLTFTALSVDYNVKSDAEAGELAERLNRMDSETWKLLAKHMEKDLKRT